MSITKRELMKLWERKKNPPAPKEKKPRVRKPVMNPKPLAMTPNRQRVLDCIRECAAKGYAPSYREIQAYCGFASQTAVTQHLQALECMGIIERERGVFRGIKLVEAQS